MSLARFTSWLLLFFLQISSNSRHLTPILGQGTLNVTDATSDDLVSITQGGPDLCTSDDIAKMDSSLNVTQALPMPIPSATAVTSSSRLYVGASTPSKPEPRQLASRAIELALARPNSTNPLSYGIARRKTFPSVSLRLKQSPTTGVSQALGYMGCVNGSEKILTRHIQISMALQPLGSTAIPYYHTIEFDAAGNFIEPPPGVALSDALVFLIAVWI
ncbi:hypothetical protein N7536_009964 [Penicillium majusculum]|nr:hypothetical protein N7536_009964 [Penicillium majusculum]